MTCYFCGVGVDGGAFCHGCKVAVCEDCGVAPVWGQHRPEEHLEEEDGD